MTGAAVDAFVERVRERRVATGRPDRIDDEGIYRVLDGLLAAQPKPQSSDTR
jgi:hypothetical protein